MSVAIVGAGLAGTAAADALAAAGRECLIYEARPHWGGHTHSVEQDGFVFDEGPHVSFTRSAEVRDVFEKGARAAGGLEEFRARITNAFRGRWVTHPAQCHLFGLDPGLVTDCIVDFVEARGGGREVRTYADWLEAMYGRTFAHTFPFAYTRKYWTVEPHAMDTDWVGARMYPPKLEEVVRGALAPDQEGDFHYLSTFRYPSRGGFQSFMVAMHRPELVRTGKAVAGVDLRRRKLEFADGTSTHFEHLVSTMPLPELVRLVRPDQVPPHVRSAADELLCTSLELVDVAVSRRDLFDHHWFYVYDEDVCFARGHFPHMLSPHNAPAGAGSIQVEVYHSRHRPLAWARESLPDRVVDDLLRLGILRDRSEVLWVRQRSLPYANVVFDLQRAAALRVIQPWTEAQGIHLAGRYGEWGYHWTDDATLSGWKAAERVLGR